MKKKYVIQDLHTKMYFKGIINYEQLLWVENLSGKFEYINSEIQLFDLEDDAIDFLNSITFEGEYGIYTILKIFINQ